MSNLEKMRLETLWAAQDKVYAQCREEGKCVCGEPFDGHDFNGCLSWIRLVKAEFLRRCDELGVEVP